MHTYNNLPIYELTYDDKYLPSLQLALVDSPAIEVDFLKFADNAKKMEFRVDDDKQIVFGPAMIPDYPIYRCDEGGEYYITFGAETIAQVAKGFAVGHQFNLMHNTAAKADCTLLESYILNAQEGKCAPQCYGELPEGTWMVKAHIDDDALWADVKAGIYRGYSIESFFNIQQMRKAQKLWRRMLCASVVAKHNDEEIALQYVEDEFAEGIAVYILDDAGALVPAPDGEYAIDGKDYIVTDGIINIKPEETAEPVAETEPAEETPAPEAMAEEEPAEEAPAQDIEGRIAAIEERVAALEAAVALLTAIPDEIAEVQEEIKKTRKRNCELDTLLNQLKEVKATPIEHQTMRSQREDRLAALFAARN